LINAGILAVFRATFAFAKSQDFVRIPNMIVFVVEKAQMTYKKEISCGIEGSGKKVRAEYEGENFKNP
jgi:hypothetical protein